MAPKGTDGGARPRTSSSNDSIRTSRYIKASADRRRDLAPKARLCPAKYRLLFVGKYRQMYRRLRSRLYRQLRLSFHLDLNLDLNLDLYQLLFRALLAKSYQSLFQQLFETLFGSMFDLKYGQLQASSYPESYRQKPAPRRPVGRGVGGRIVARNGPTTTYRQSYATMATRVAPVR
jgi:hypothetical protein